MTKAFDNWHTFKRHYQSRSHSVGQTVFRHKWLSKYSIRATIQ